MVCKRFVKCYGGFNHNLLLQNHFRKEVDLIDCILIEESYNINNATPSVVCIESKECCWCRYHHHHHHHLQWQAIITRGKICYAGFRLYKEYKFHFYIIFLVLLWRKSNHTLLRIIPWIYRSFLWMKHHPSKVYIYIWSRYNLTWL